MVVIEWGTLASDKLKVNICTWESERGKGIILERDKVRETFREWGERNFQRKWEREKVENWEKEDLVSNRLLQDEVTLYFTSTNYSKSE